MNFSDRFLAKVSCTDPNSGNTVGQVLETLRKLGTPLQERWDFGPDIDSVEKFYATVPPKLFDYARQDFLDTYNFKYEDVPIDKETIKKALKCSVIGVGLVAWFRKGDIYYSPEGTSANHFCVIYGYDDEKQAWKIFDSYDGFQKLYSYDSILISPKRFYISKKDTQKKSLWQKIVAYLLEFFK